jgi:hypothetical protein
MLIDTLKHNNDSTPTILAQLQSSTKMLIEKKEIRKTDKINNYKKQVT